MNRGWLASELERGKSLEQIGRELGCHASTVGYWAAKHGLRPAGAERFKRRGPPDRERLEALAAEGATLKEMAAVLDRSIATVRHWLARWEIIRGPRPLRRQPVDPSTAPSIAYQDCVRHGLTKFRLEGRGSYRCMQCRQERVSEWRRRVKRLLVAEAGGRCELCGYARCVAALHFHHRDPSEKSFELSRRGVTRGLAEARAEAGKCVLLCANCHAEVEAGVTRAATAETAPRGGLEPP